tara:strand:+ start:2989 stop:3294 length:306 start_codon:yes stop_codon:yes gene_type:complete
MSDRINRPDIEAEIRSIWNETGKSDFHPSLRHLAYCELTEKLLHEMKRCYKEIDELLGTIGSWGYVMCPRSTEWFEWDYGCQSETCASHDDDCRELVEASQ